MKKKFLLALMALVCALCCAFSLAACDDPQPTVIGLVAVMTGEQPAAADNFKEVEATYGETPEIGHKIYLRYSDNSIGSQEITLLNDDKLSVAYSFTHNDNQTETLQSLPAQYLAGMYKIEYSYQGIENDLLKKVTIQITVDKSNSGAFSIQPQRSSWGEDEIMPAVTVKQGNTTVQNTNSDSNLQKNDSDGMYFVYCIKKEAYDTLTEAQRTDWDYMCALQVSDNSKPSDERAIFAYWPGEENILPAGSYVLYAEMLWTHNYAWIITPGVNVTVNA